VSYDIATKELPDQLSLTVRTTVSQETMAQGMTDAFQAIMAHADGGGGSYAGPPFCLYPEMPEGEFEIVVAMPVNPGATPTEGVALEEVPGGSVVTTMHRGSYSAIGEAYEALGAWMAMNGKGPAGPPREVYLNDPSSVAESELLTEVDGPIS
jgi:effector-binding domain-containing protein